MSAPRNVAAHRLLKNAKWLDGFANVFGAIVDGFYKLPGTSGIKNLLHGTWPLRHPLHPAITDITIGAYTAVVALDVLFLFNSQSLGSARVANEPGLAHAADFVLLAAFISSLIAVASGLTDWKDTFGEERRTGMLHGLIMVVATILFVASISLRLPGGIQGAELRTLAIGLSTLGWIVMLVGAFFGGEMAYGYGTQVNRQAWSDVPKKWERLDVSSKSLEDRKPVVLKATSGMDLFVVKLDETIYAMGNTCTHAGGPLNEGKWIGTDRCEIECPWHGSRFCVKDGEAKGGPATFGEPRFETRVNDSGYIEVKAL